MEYEFQPVDAKVKPTNCFQVHVTYEHGDADSSNKHIYTLKTTNVDDVEKYLLTFNAVAKAIKDIRSYGSEVPKFLKGVDSINVEGTMLTVYVEPDLYASMTMDNYYASMKIDKVIYFDSNGLEFKFIYKL